MEIVMGLFFVTRNGETEIVWVRLGLAFAFLVLLVLGSYFTAGSPAHSQLHNALTGPIESVIGLMIGLIAGEAIATK